jgi:hypothetical protein
MTRQTWEEEADSRLLHRIEKILERQTELLEEIFKRLPPPPTYLPTNAIVVIVDK